MRKKILFYAPMEYDNTSFYRCSGILPYLTCTDYEMINSSQIQDWNWSTFINIDVFFCHRPCTQEHINMMTLAKDAGCKVIVDYDDNLFAVTMENPTYQFYQDNKVFILRSLRIADEVWVTTETVKLVYEKFNKNCFVIPNAHNDYVLKNKRSFNFDTKRAMWRGGTTHEGDVYSVADELIAVINSNKDWTFNFFGHAFNYMEMRCGNNYIRTSSMTTLQYFKAIEDYNANILIFPLMDNEFNRSKSNIAWIEGAYAGAAFFGGDNLSEFKKAGVADFSHLKDELNNPDFSVLKVANEASWQYITDNLLLSKINNLRHERLLSLC